MCILVLHNVALTFRQSTSTPVCGSGVVLAVWHSRHGTVLQRNEKDIKIRYQYPGLLSNVCPDGRITSVNYEMWDKKT